MAAAAAVRRGAADRRRRRPAAGAGRLDHVATTTRIFAKVIVNRVWADLMGRGLVEPVDDLRATNPPTNGPLLDALAADFRAAKYDLKQLIRTICTSYVYGLSSLPNERNVGDRQNYSRHYRTRLRGEVLLDAVSDITGVAETFSAMPAGSRANRAVDDARAVGVPRHLRPAEPEPGPALRADERHDGGAGAAPDERPALHQQVTADSGRAAELAASDKSPEQIVEELYLLVYSRLPDDGRARDRPAVVRGKRNFAAPGDRRFDVGAAEHAGVCVQGLSSRRGRRSVRQRSDEEHHHDDPSQL